MDMITLLVIALGLAMDAFAVSVANGTATKRLRTNNAIKMATFFGSFQAFMPAIGWVLGLGLIDFVSGVDHWVAFGLLSFIGCKMIYESAKKDPGTKEIAPLTLPVLLTLSLATSVDALAVGLSFAFLRISIAIPIMVIGTVTFLLSSLGVWIGNKLGHFFENKIETAGGLILIGIGIEILIEHSF